MDNLLKDYNDYIDLVSELVFKRIIEKYGDIYPLNFTNDQEEILIGELAKLTTILEMLKEKEQYEKCAEIQRKINKIQEKLKNL
tara:strand:+ start:734 stop:985 length:252 start_codon:yes stop_codon:yes gene_type:complete